MSMHRQMAQMMRAPAAPPGGIITEGLINRWALDEGSGTDIYDSVGGVNGTIVNPANNWAGGRGVDLNGTDQYITLDAGVIIPISSSTAYSVCLWWKFITPQLAYQCPLNFSTNTSKSVLTIISTNASYGDFWFYFGSDPVSSQGQRIDPLTNPPGDRWVFTVFTCVGEFTDRNTGIYMDSVSSSLTTVGTQAGTANNNRIGVNGSSANPFKGSLEDIRIYDRILSQVEIDSIFAGTG